MESCSNMTIPRNWWAIALATLAALITAVVFWPSAWSPDTVSQIEQARSGKFTDQHPPILALVLRPLAILRVEKIMILVQSAAYWLVALGVFYSSRAARPRELTLAALTLLLPSSIALIGVMWKDVHLALAWSMAWALLLFIRHTGAPRRLLLPAAGLLILYGVLLRYNAFLAVPPLLLMLVLGKPWMATTFKTFSAYLFLAIASFCIAQGTNRYVIPVSHVPTAEMSLPIFDLAGITYETGENAFPFPITGEQVSQVRSCYRPVMWNGLYAGNSPCRWLMQAMVDYGNRGKSINAAWIGAIVANPAAYLRHRAAFVRSFFTHEHEKNNGTHRASYTWHWAEDPVSARGPIIIAYIAYTEAWERLGLMTPLAALIWAGSLIAYVANRRGPGWELQVGAALVSALNILSHVPFGIASDQRYAYPSFVLLAFASAALLLRSTRARTVEQA